MFLNLTPHPITIQKPDKTKITIEPSGIVARVDSIEEPLPDIDGIPTVRRKWGEVNLGIPLDKDSYYIVSSLVLNALQGKSSGIDSLLVAPDTGTSAIRDDQGQVVAITRIIRM